MNKKLVAALSGGAVLILTLSGCSNEKNNEVNKDLVAWAGKLCSDVPALKAKIDTASASIQKVSSNGLPPKEVQQTLSQAFQAQAEGYKGLADAISGAGAPPGVENGATKQQNAVQALTSLSTSYAGLKTKTDALDTKSEAKFSVGLEAVATDLKTLKTSDTALTDLETGDVKRAMVEQDTCKQTAVPTPPADTSATPSAPAVSPSASKPAGSSASPSASTAG
ncbi:small secreted protein [Streptomyces sp. NPDC004539]|uniref:small secreted protein n=1 Tax=Streptomyces sp. NPDC004539 TaxID=3154280 RepID=UPI0033AFAB3A